jgi:hypothetical protein
MKSFSDGDYFKDYFEIGLRITFPFTRILVMGMGWECN